VAITLDITQLGTPINLNGVAGAVGADGLPDGNYYIRVCAESTGACSWVIYHQGDPSAELGPIACANGDGLNKITLTWDAVVDVTYYNVYLREAGDADYYEKKYNERLNASTSTNSITIDKASEMGRDHWDTFASRLTMPGGLSKDIGGIRINFTGSGDIEDLYDQLVTDGYGAYVFYDGWSFVLKGSIYLTGAVQATLDATKKVHFVFIKGTLNSSNTHVGTAFPFGELSNNLGRSGCTFHVLNYNGFIYCQNGIAFYSCIFLPYYKNEGLLFKSGGIVIELGSTGELQGGFFEGNLNPKANTSDLTVLNNNIYLQSKDKTHTDLVHINSDGSKYSALALYGLYSSGCKFIRFISKSKSDGTGDHIRWRGGSYSNPVNFNNTSFNSANGRPNMDGTSGSCIFTRDFNVEIENDAGDYVSGVTVDLEDKDGNAVWTQGTKSTDATGRLAADVEVTFESWLDNVWTVETPFTLTLNKGESDELVIYDLGLAGLGAVPFLGQYSLPVAGGGADVEIEVNSGRLMKRLSDQLMLQL